MKKAIGNLSWLDIEAFIFLLWTIFERLIGDRGGCYYGGKGGRWLCGEMGAYDEALVLDSEKGEDGIQSLREVFAIMFCFY